MISDLDDIFSQAPMSTPNQTYGSAYPEDLYLQSPISMPTAPLNLDNTSSYIGGNDLALKLGSDPKPIPTPMVSNKRVADFSIPEYDFSTNLDSQFYGFPEKKTQYQQYNPYPLETRKMQPYAFIDSQPNLSAMASEPQISLTFDDVCQNFQLMQQHTLNKATRNQGKSGPLSKKKIPKQTKKQIFRPFASIESCELSVDKMRSFFEAHRRKSNRRNLF